MMRRESLLWLAWMLQMSAEIVLSLIAVFFIGVVLIIFWVTRDMEDGDHQTLFFSRLSRAGCMTGLAAIAAFLAMAAIRQWLV